MNWCWQTFLCKKINCFHFSVYTKRFLVWVGHQRFGPAVDVQCNYLLTFQQSINSQDKNSPYFQPSQRKSPQTLSKKESPLGRRATFESVFKRCVWLYIFELSQLTPLQKKRCPITIAPIFLSAKKRLPVPSLSWGFVTLCLYQSFPLSIFFSKAATEIEASKLDSKLIELHECCFVFLQSAIRGEHKPQVKCETRWARKQCKHTNCLQFTVFSVFFLWFNATKQKNLGFRL